MKNSIHPLVAVVWDDAKATAVVEYDLNEVRTQFHKAARYTTYGLLLVDDDKGITLASEEGDDQNLRRSHLHPSRDGRRGRSARPARAKKARQKRSRRRATLVVEVGAIAAAGADDPPLRGPGLGSDDDDLSAATGSSTWRGRPGRTPARR